CAREGGSSNLYFYALDSW
nr:immunoglobulin heavy chain junction region [Macaca mulatta]